MLEECADEKSFERVCLYLTSCANYVTEPEDMEILKCACSIYRKVNKYPQALRTALKIGDMELVRKIYDDCVDVRLSPTCTFLCPHHQDRFLRILTVPFVFMK